MYLQLIDKDRFFKKILNQSIVHNELRELCCIIWSQVVLGEEFSLVEWNIEKELWRNSPFDFLVEWVKAVTEINTFDEEF